MSHNEGYIKIDKLNDDNYRAWAYRMQGILEEKEVWNTMMEAKPDNVTQEDWKLKEEKAKRLIVFYVEDRQLIYIKNCKTGREAWETLKNHHLQPTVSARTAIFRKLCKTQLQTGESMRNHINNMLQWIDQLAEMNSPLKEDVAVGILLASLNKDYETTLSLHFKHGTKKN